MAGFVRIRLLDSNDVIERYTDSSLRFLDYSVIGVGYKHKQLLVPLTRLIEKLA